MKILFLALTALILGSMLGCSAMAPHPKAPQIGETACSTDYQCPENFVCSFKGVGTYATCVWMPGENRF